MFPVEYADMDGLPDLHDGFLDGVWMSEEKRVHLFVRTHAGQPSTVVLKDVERLNVPNLRQGNVVFDVVVIAPDKLSASQIAEMYQINAAETDLILRLLAKARERGLLALEITPSYGAEGIVLFGALEIMPGHVLPADSAAPGLRDVS